MGDDFDSLCHMLNYSSQNSLNYLEAKETKIQWKKGLTFTKRCNLEMRQLKPKKNNNYRYFMFLM